MPDLLIACDAPNELEAVNRVGGRPLAPRGMAWPTCAECHRSLHFLAQLRLDGAKSPQRGLLLLFMCGNELCETWDADAGANFAAVVPMDGLAPMELPPVEEDVLLGFTAGAQIERIEVDEAKLEFGAEEAYDAARERWGRSRGRQRDVLGQLGGTPGWLQGDATPSCACGEKMRFAAQLEQGPDHRTEMNFGGGGCAYAFVCGRCQGRAKFLWQS